MTLIRKFLGLNPAAARWAAAARTHADLAPTEHDVLQVVAAFSSHNRWDGFRLCIAWITERVRWARRTVQRALDSLKAKGLLLRDGQVPVKEGRPVVKYRLGGTPECPLPQAVSDAREEAREAEMCQDQEWESSQVRGGFGAYHKQSEGTASSYNLLPSKEEAATISRPAEPVKTRPTAQQQGTRGVRVRRAPYLRRARALAAALLEARGARGAGGGPRGSVGASGSGVVASSVGGVAPCRNLQGAVTYCHPQQSGAEVTPFTETALFSIPAPAPLKPNHTLEFDTFWAHYPRKTGKGAARKAFIAALRVTTAATIIEAVTAYSTNCQAIGKDHQFIPHPTTWLNQERWDDELETAPQVRSRVDDALRSGLELVAFYQQQESLEGFSGPKELGW